MRLKFSPTLLMFCLVLTVLLLLRLLFGMYYEEGTDPYFITIMAGIFSEQPENILNTYGFHFGTSYLFKYLYTWFPGIPWYDFAILTFLSLSLTFIFQLSGNLLRNSSLKIAGPTGVIVLLAVLILFFENLVLIQITRVVILLTVASAALLITEQETLSSRKKILLHVCLLAGLLSRIEPAMLSWAILLPWALFSFGPVKENLKKIIKSWWLFGAMSLLVTIGLNIPFNEADAEYQEFRPYQFTLWDFEQPGTPPDLADKKDSIIYKAASQSFLTDRQNINSSFFEKVGVNPLDKSPGYFGNYFNDLGSRYDTLRKNLGKSIGEYPYLAISALIAFLGIFTWLLLNDRKNIFRFILIQSSFALLLVFLCAFLKMEARVFAPLIQVEILLCFCFLLPEKKIQVVGKVLLGTIIAGLTLTNLIQLFIYSQPKMEARKVSSLYTESVISEISAKYDSKKIWVNLHVMDRLFVPLLHPHELPGNLDWESLDNAILFYNPGWKSKMKKISGTEIFPELVTWILDHPEENYFLSTLERMELIREYCAVVNEISFSFQEIPSEFNDNFRKLYPEYKTPYKIGLYELKSE